MDFLRGCHQTLKVWGTPRIGDWNDDIGFYDCGKRRGINSSGIDPLDKASCNVEKLFAAHFEVEIGIEKWKSRKFIHFKKTYFTFEHPRFGNLLFRYVNSKLITCLTLSETGNAGECIHGW